RFSEKDAGTALAEYQRAVELDPSFALAWASLAETHLWFCKYSTQGGLAIFDAELARARDAATRALTLEPNLPEALRARADIQLNFDFDWKAGGETLRTALARWRQKRMPEADAALADLINNNADGAAYQIAEVYAYRGEKDRAFEWLERAHRQRDSGLALLQIDPFLKNLHPDPRWNAFLHKMGLANDQLK